MLGLMLLSAAAVAAPAEYHWTICEPSAEAVAKKLGGTATAAGRRYNFYFDTKARDYYRAGVVLRMRGAKGEPVESTVKIKEKARRAGDCEWDYVGDSASNHCKAESETDERTLKDVVDGRATADRLFDATQKRFLRSKGHDPRWGALEAVGPVDNHKWKVKVPGGGLTIESFRLASGATLWELSGKSKAGSPAEFRKLGAQWAAHGVKLCPVQTSKTRWVLSGGK